MKIINENINNTLNNLFPEFEKIGNTTLVKVHGDEQGGGIFAKLEWENLTGSIKDRAALEMVLSEINKFENLEEARKNLHLLEYSGGSLAFSLARICDILSLQLTLVVGDWLPENVLDKLRSKCQELVVTPKEKGFYEVIKVAKQIQKDDLKYSFLNQHENLNCMKAHFKTCSEILEKLDGVKIDSWVSAIGTGATLMGVGSVLIKYFPEIRINGVTPSEQPYATKLPPNGHPKFAGSGGLGNGLLQRFIESNHESIPVDKHWEVSFKEANAAVYKVYLEKGLSIGNSAAANFLVAYEEYKNLGKGSVVVTTFPASTPKGQIKNLKIKLDKQSIYSYL